MKGKKKLSLLLWWDTVLSRIGKTDKERFAWIVNLAQKSEEMTPGDLANRQLEFAVFLGEDTLGVSMENGKVEVPTKEETRRLLEHIKSIVQKAIGREKIAVAPPRRGGEIIWEEKENRFRYRVEPDEEWTARATRVLKDLLVEYGHLLKRCPAPAIRGREGEICGNWFLASRPNEKYCSPRCQSRTTTRKARTKIKAHEVGEPKRDKAKPKKPKN